MSIVLWYWFASVGSNREIDIEAGETEKAREGGSSHFRRRCEGMVDTNVQLLSVYASVLITLVHAI
jgi:hypothetical protein